MNRKIFEKTGICSAEQPPNAGALEVIAAAPEHHSMQVEAVGNSPSWQSDLSTAFTGVLAPTQPDDLYMDLSSACKPWSGSHNINTTRNETLPWIFPELIGKFPDGESD